MKIVVAIDKFKGSATAQQLAQCIDCTIRRHMPGTVIEQVPIADGGDGTAYALALSLLTPLQGKREVKVPGPLPSLTDDGAQQPTVIATYYVDTAHSTAYMDLASASGLTLVPSADRDVMHSSTFGTGVMIHDAITHGVSHIVLGLGGSATCDGAMGLLAALGCEFLDAEGHRLLPSASNLRCVVRVDTSEMEVVTRGVKFTLLVDVSNPLTGPNGAARVFAPQKGASPLQVDELEQGLDNLARFMPAGISCLPGAGAAGGVAAGMAAFLGATITPGIDYVLDVAHFDSIVADANLVITGEGRIDSQTAMGKAPQGVLKVARRHGVPVIALCGSIALGTSVSQLGFARVIEVTPHDMPLNEAMDTAMTLSNVEKAVTSFISNWK